MRQFLYFDFPSGVTRHQRCRRGYARQATVSMLSVFSTVLWVVFGAAGVAGLLLGYQPGDQSKKEKVPVTVERLNVDVVKTMPHAAPTLNTTPIQPVPEPSVVQGTELPKLLSVAEPALYVPVPLVMKEPSTVVATSGAVLSQAQQTPAAGNSKPVERLTLGEGEGDQPAPEYPREAKLAHQQGSVIVQMTIGENGDVTDASVTSPCAWPILNQAALRAVRDTWHFGKGPVRYRDIEFVFELHQR